MILYRILVALSLLCVIICGIQQELNLSNSEKIDMPLSSLAQYSIRKREHMIHNVRRPTKFNVKATALKNSLDKNQHKKYSNSNSDETILAGRIEKRMKQERVYLDAYLLYLSLQTFFHNHPEYKHNTTNRNKSVQKNNQEYGRRAHWEIIFG